MAIPAGRYDSRRTSFSYDTKDCSAEHSLKGMPGVLLADLPEHTGG